MAKNNLPTVTADQLRVLCQRMAAEAQLDPAHMLDRSGRAAANLAAQLLDDDVADRPIVVLAGNNDNGAVGLIAACHLLAEEAWIQVVLATEPEQYKGHAAAQLAYLQTMDAPIAWAEEGWELPPADLVIDALMDDVLHDDNRGDNPSHYPSTADLIQLANSTLAPILSLSIPSGIARDSGEPLTPHIRADATLMFGLPWAGLRVESTRSICGECYLADIGIPPHLYAELGIPPPPAFAANGILPLP